MATIVTRSGKGSPLSHTEMDSNFTNLNTELAGAGGSTTLGGLTDVNNSTPTTGQTLTWSGTEWQPATASGGSAVSTYADIAALVTAGSSATNGDLAYVTGVAGLFLYHNGWYKIGAVNQTPTIDSLSPAGAQNLDTTGTAVTITVNATDAEGLPLTYSYNKTDSTSAINSVVQGTGANTNQFVVTPNTSISNAGVATITYSVSDGVNTAQTSQTFTLEFTPIFGAFDILPQVTNATNNSMLYISNLGSGSNHAGYLSQANSGVAAQRELSVVSDSEIYICDTNNYVTKFPWTQSNLNSYSKTHIGLTAPNGSIFYASAMIAGNGYLYVSGMPAGTSGRMQLHVTDTSTNQRVGFYDGSSSQNASNINYFIGFFGPGDKWLLAYDYYHQIICYDISDPTNPTCASFFEWPNSPTDRPINNVTQLISTTQIGTLGASVHGGTSGNSYILAYFTHFSNNTGSTLEPYTGILCWSFNNTTGQISGTFKTTYATTSNNQNNGVHTLTNGIISDASLTQFQLDWETGYLYAVYGDGSKCKFAIFKSGGTFLNSAPSDTNGISLGTRTDPANDWYININAGWNSDVAVSHFHTKQNVSSPSNWRIMGSARILERGSLKQYFVMLDWGSTSGGFQYSSGLYGAMRQFFWVDLAHLETGTYNSSRGVANSNHRRGGNEGFESWRFSMPHKNGPFYLSTMYYGSEIMQYQANAGSTLLTRLGTS